MPPTDKYRAPEVDANRPAATTWKAVDMAIDNNKKANTKLNVLVSATSYHESNTLSSMFVASENDIDDVILVRSDVEQMNCDENEFLNDDDDVDDNESEDVEPTYESEDKEVSEEEEDDGID
ncbi:hypothetical protein L6452_25682 [Arctium lappa]|uniref:Uncharacterized protein n=1 Tax=Arctium lappa TaxID=4217 RepID=A0ACB9ABQ9_ARCLA|nr:hypothetical protein L6452_25682 [Arctium lappa]